MENKKDKLQITTLTISKELHKQLRISSAKAGVNIGDFVSRLLEIGIKFNLYNCDLSKLEQLKNNPE